ncbi:MAG: hypothetical protein ACI37S_05030 [Candidatus Gastranaerophilaceae bacterium]
MNVTEFEKRLYNLLLNHLNEQYNLAEYIELLEYENNSILNYILSHAYFAINDKENSDKYRNFAKELNSNFDFEDDYKNIFLYIYFLFSTITTQESPFLDDEIDKLFSSNPTLQNYIKASELYRNNNDIGNSVRVTNLGIKQFPDDLSLKYDMASNLLYSRNIDSAWGYNELRFDSVRNKLPQFINKPKFTLQKTSAKVYIYPVTKLGDTIFFARYVIKLKQDYPNLKLFVKVDSSLRNLFEQNGITTYNKVDKSMIDYQISFEGLPFLYQNKGSKLLSEGYLKANNQQSNDFKNKYFSNNKLKIGIVWNSSKSNDSRNIKLQDFETLFNIENTQFYSLQKEVTLQEELYFSKFNIVNMGIKINDFSDTAAIIDNLDIVIGCDTSVTNLSGAMGKETLLLLPNHSDWRWELFEQNSNWYKSIKLYRQKNNQSYNEVFDRIKEYLTKH